MTPFLRYCEARARTWREESLYRAYVSDALHAMGRLNTRYRDLLGRPGSRDADESAEDIRARISGKLKAMAMGG